MEFYCYNWEVKFNISLGWIILKRNRKFILATPRLGLLIQSKLLLGYLFKGKVISEEFHITSLTHFYAAQIKI